MSCVAIVAMTVAHTEPVPLACGKAMSQLDDVLAREPPGTLTTLREPLLACIETHRICGVVYDNTQAHAHVFFGEQSSDIPQVKYYDGGASYALMASRSLPPSRKSGLEYCLALTPGEQKSDAPFDWHGWQILPGGQIRELDLSKESAAGVHTNPRSMAVALWNLYETRF
jgi:hypothetical protein